jgi:hypothetical protein
MACKALALGAGEEFIALTNAVAHIFPRAIGNTPIL